MIVREFKELTERELLDVINSAGTCNVSAQRKKYNYKELYCGFDIETTYCYMYIWQFSIFSNTQELIVYGRTWGEFTDFIKLLKDSTKGVYLLVGVHNLKFEWQWLRSRINVSKVFAAEYRDIYYFDSDNIRFIDTIKFYNANLDKVAKMINCEHKKTGDLDYTIQRNSHTKLTDKELNYCLYDVIICSRIMAKLFKDEIITEHYIPVSQTAIIRHKIKRRARLGKYVNDRKRVNKCQLQPELYYWLRGERVDGQIISFFEGGYTHANPYQSCEIHYNVKHFDYTSSYPYMMLTQTYPYEIEEVEPKLYKPQFVQGVLYTDYIMEIEYTNIRSDFMGVLPMSRCIIKGNRVIDNGKIYSADIVITRRSARELLTYHNYYKYDNIKVRRAYRVTMDYLPGYVTDVIKEAYTAKKKLKREGRTDSPDYLKSKQLINGIYGMTVTEVKLKEYTAELSTDGITYNLSDSVNDIKDVFSKRANSPLLDIWGMYVTMYARCRLLDDIDRLGRDYFIYSDTDSAFYKDKSEFTEHIENSNILIREYNTSYLGVELDDIGQYTMEHDSEMFKTAGAKKYIEYYDKEYHFTLAGIGKNTINEYCKDNNISPWDIIERGTIDEMYTYKLRPVFYDSYKNEDITDLTGFTESMEEYTSQELIPVSWQTSLTYEYQKILDTIKVNKKLKI